MSIEMFAAFGVGSVISAAISILLNYILNEKLKRKSISFEEKKTAFIGLIDAYRQGWLLREMNKQ